MRASPFGPLASEGREIATVARDEDASVVRRENEDVFVGEPGELRFIRKRADVVAPCGQ